jgi:phage FluMu gp28-like protein
MLRSFQERRVRVPAEAAVRDDLCRVRKLVTSGGHLRYDADSDGHGHADRFWALALALYAADHRAARVAMQALPARVTEVAGVAD